VVVLLLLMAWSAQVGCQKESPATPVDPPPDFPNAIGCEWEYVQYDTLYTRLHFPDTLIDVTIDTLQIPIAVVDSTTLDASGRPVMVWDLHYRACVFYGQLMTMYATLPAENLQPGQRDTIIFFTSTSRPFPRYYLVTPFSADGQWACSRCRYDTAYVTREGPLRVPAGVFDPVYRSSYHYSLPEGHVTITHWYAPRLGIVQASQSGYVHPGGNTWYQWRATMKLVRYRIPH
jgi:hypothetical protein